MLDREIEKTAVERILVKLEELTGGNFYNGSDIANIKGRELKRYRRRFKLSFRIPTLH